MEVVFLGILAILGVAQSDPLRHLNGADFIENLRSAADSRIVAGWPAQEGQIPHQVSIRMVNNAGAVSACGGSVIDHHWVITAAHCVANRDTFVVRFGLTNLTQPAFIYETTRKYIHPDYIEIQAGVQPDDIALLGFDQYIPYGPTIQPCRLQNSADKDVNYKGVVLTVSGYGLTEDSWNGGVTSEILNWVHLRGITNEECENWYNERLVRPQTICAEYYNDTAQSSCQGDSGGPLTFVDVDGKPTMIGVVSFGSSAGCNSPFPSAYVRPGYYHEWFEEVTGISFDWNREDLEVDGDGDDQEQPDEESDGGNDGPDDNDAEDDGQDPENQPDDDENDGSDDNDSDDGKDSEDQPDDGDNDIEDDSANDDGSDDPSDPEENIAPVVVAPIVAY